ncbi:MAG: Nif11-like leader peptide family natural product precursor [Proteobacteria bacterium]|nr:Nif11-like leader peptide family natural product precursor [Pseudomonadota bacterium]
MSAEEIKRFQTEANKNKALQKELVEVGSDLAKIVERANKHGYKFTQKELQAAIDAKKTSQADGALGDDDLEKVAGGAVVSVLAGAAI